MGLKELFGFGGSDEKAVKKAADALANKYGPTENRHKAIDTLVSIGTPEAIQGLLGRFAIRVDNGIIDTEERERALEAVTGFERAAIEPIRAFLVANDAVTWPLRALSRIASTDEVVTIVTETLAKLGTEYVRVPEHKVELIAHLESLKDPRVVDAVLPFLNDVQEDVRLTALATLTAQGDSKVRDAFVALLTSPKSSARLRAAVAQRLSEVDWPVGDTSEVVRTMLPPAYTLDAEGRVRARGETATHSR